MLSSEPSGKTNSVSKQITKLKNKDAKDKRR